MVKILILLTGLPGSGKSHKAKEIFDESLSMGLSAEIHSTDSYFLDSDGVYRFDKDLLHTNHQKNIHAVETAMDAGVDVVLVDNTNSTRREYLPYIDAAKERGYVVKFAQSSTPWRDNPSECAKKTIHGVPIDVLVHMHMRMNADKTTKNIIGFVDTLSGMEKTIP